MELHKLPKLVKRSGKRVGRGIGSGRGGHTSSRGTKGQKAREKVPLIFEGTKFKKSLIKRLPMLRGRNKLKSWSVRPVIINLKDLNEFKGEVVTVDALIKQGIVGTKAEKVLIQNIGSG
jgi:large subunit ribosomal protein L15